MAKALSLKQRRVENERQKAETGETETNAEPVNLSGGESSGRRSRRLARMEKHCRRAGHAVTLADVATHSKEQSAASRIWRSNGLYDIGLEHIEGESNDIIGEGDIASVKSTASCLSIWHVLYGKLRPYLCEKSLNLTLMEYARPTSLSFRLERLPGQWLSALFPFAELHDGMDATQNALRNQSAPHQALRRSALNWLPTSPTRRAVTYRI